MAPGHTEGQLRLLLVSPNTRSPMLRTIGFPLALMPALAAAQVTPLPNEPPAKVVPTNAGFDYVRREAMIPMRDGVRVHTGILLAKKKRGGGGVCVSV